MATRATLTLLPRRAGPSTLLYTRPFSQSVILRAASNEKDDLNAVRRNPLIGNYHPAASNAGERDGSVSTEHPNATSTPSPDRSPVSSAEVAPNADLPPRPPPVSGARNSANLASAKSEFPYDAAARSAPRINNSPSAQKRSTSLDFLSMLDTRNSIHNQTVTSLDPLARPKVRAAAVTGRTIFIKRYPGENTATTAPQALNKLNMLVKNQAVKAKFNYQKFHERRGMKKKRLRMVRWRKQFKMGFKETVKRVMELKRQGW